MWDCSLYCLPSNATPTPTCVHQEATIATVPPAVLVRTCLGRATVFNCTSRLCKAPTCADSCNAGYAGCTCAAVACPANSVGTSIPAGCACNADHVGNIRATVTSPYYTGACVAAHDRLRWRPRLHVRRWVHPWQHNFPSRARICAISRRAHDVHSRAVPSEQQGSQRARGMRLCSGFPWQSECDHNCSILPHNVLGCGTHARCCSSATRRHGRATVW